MKTLPVFAAHGRRGKARCKETPPILFKVFIGYADVTAVRRAMSTVADAVRASRRPVQIQPMVWRFAQLESSHWRDRAITAAMSADIVVLASSIEQTELPDGVEAWVNAFLAANRGRKATLVSVAGEREAWTISIEQPIAQANTTAVKRDSAPVSDEALVA